MDSQATRPRLTSLKLHSYCQANNYGLRASSALLLGKGSVVDSACLGPLVLAWQEHNFCERSCLLFKRCVMVAVAHLLLLLSGDGFASSFQVRSGNGHLSVHQSLGFE